MAVVGAVYVASGTALAVPLEPIAVQADGNGTLEVGCEGFMVTAVNGSVSASVAPCSYAPSVSITGTSNPDNFVDDHHVDVPSDVHEHVASSWAALVDVNVTGDLVVDGPVVIDGKMVIVSSSITASSITITGTGGVKLKEGASLIATGGPIIINGTEIGVILDGGSSIDANSGPVDIFGGNIIVSGTVESTGGDITILGKEAGFTWVGGSIDTWDTSPTGIGGDIVISIGAVVIGSDSSINSTGTKGGGKIYIGGGPRGEGDTPTAKSVIVSRGASIRASAIANGNGGEVVIWADDMTAYDGDISTNGGYTSGNGGDVEISSKISLEQKGTIDTTAPNGEDGAILIDPLYYMVLPNAIPLITDIDDLDHMLIKSGLIVDTGQFIYDYFESLFTGTDLTSGISPGSLDVRYGSTNSIIGALGFAEKHGTVSMKKALLPYSPIITALKVRGLFSMVRTATLEAYTGDVSVQSIFGIGIYHGLLDPAGTDNGLNFTNQGTGETVTFETMFSVQSHGDISVGGGDLTLHAGAPFDLGVVEDIIIGAVPGGTTIAAALDMDDFLHDLDIAVLVRAALISSFTSETGGSAAVGFVNLTCNGCIPEVVGLSSDVYFDPAGNFEYIDDILAALGAPIPGWFADTTAAIDDVFDVLPGTNAGDALDIALGGYVIPGIPGLELTLCLTGPGGSFGIEDSYQGGSTECWIVPPSTTIAGVVTDFPATCNAIPTTDGAGDCWLPLFAPYDAQYASHTHYSWTDHWCNPASAVSVPANHGACALGGHAEDDYTTHYCAGVIVFGSHDCKVLDAFAGSSGLYVSAWSECLGTWFRGDCYTIAPSEGEYVSGCYSIVPPILGIVEGGVCYSTPPIPIPGICDIDPAIPCSSAELAELTFMPLLISGIESAVSFNTGVDFSALNAMGGGFPDSIGIPAFSVENQVPAIVYVEKVDNPNGGINLINTGIGDVLIAKTVSGNIVTIDSRASVKNHQYQSSSFDITAWDASTNPTGPGNAVIQTGNLKITADGKIGEDIAPLGVKQVGADIKIDIDNSGWGGVVLHGENSLSFTADSTINSSSDFSDAIDIDSKNDLTIPSGVVITADNDPSDPFGGGITLEVDADDTDAAGGTLTYRGSAVGENLNLMGNGNWDRFDVDGSVSAGIPVGVFGNGGYDTLDFDPAGHSVSHGFGQQLNVLGGYPVTLSSVERVNGVAPTLYGIVDQSTHEGGILSIPYTFIDWGADEWDVTLTDLGTNLQLAQQTTTGTPDGLGPFGPRTFSYVFADDDEHDLRLCVTDNGDGGVSCADFHVSVGNENPTTYAGVDQIVYEGDIVALDPATFNDLGTLDTHAATVVWGDVTATDSGVVTQTPFGPPGSTAGQNGTVDGSHVYADDGLYDVMVTVTDDDLGVSSDTMTVEVRNAPPVVEAGLGGTVPEGDVYSLSGVTFTDPGTLDTHTATIDWGDGSIAVGIVGQSPSGPPGNAAGQSGTVAGAHIYADDGTYTVVVSVLDDDGGSHSDTLDVEVTNVNPTIVPSGDAEVIIFSPLNIDSAFSDPGFDCPTCGPTSPPPGVLAVLLPGGETFEDFTGTIDWGDGNIEPMFVNETPGSPGVLTTGTVIATHYYDWVGTYTVTATVTDDDGGAAAFSYDVEVLGGRSLKIAAIDELTPFVGESDAIEEAVEELNKLIDWKYWTDEVHPDPKRGKKVFSGEAEAAEGLMEALGLHDDDEDDNDRRNKDKDDDEDVLSPEAIVAINEALRFMLTADLIMATISIEEAEATVAWSPQAQRSVDRLIDKAREQLVEAQEDLDNGRFEHAIDNYSKAWRYAVLAQRIAVPPAHESYGDTDHSSGDDRGRRRD